MSPRSRNASPRLSGTAMAQRSSSDTLQGTSAGKTSPMEVFLRDYTDSEDEGGFLPATCLPSIDELPHEELRGMGMGMNICMDSQFTELSDAPPFGKQPSSQRRPPSGLAPIDTTVGSPRTGTGTGTGSGQGQGNGSRPKSKRSREAAETPSKKAKTEEALLRAMHISARHACYSPQPPFNSGVPSIFAPQSLTPETNPFFLQSTLPSCQRLPPIRTLLQSELANPFAAYIPVALHAELPHARFHVPDEVSAQVRREAISAVDPAVGYGFTFGNTAAVGPPPEASATSFTAAEEASRGTGSVVTPTESTDAPGQGFSAYVSTPNIDRACQYLSFR